jgi:integrase
MAKDKLVLPLTDRGVAAIKPAPKGERPIYWDELVRGLGLRVSDAGRKTFIVVRRVNGGKLVNHTVGTYPDSCSLASARDKAREDLLTLAGGRTPKEVEAERAAARGPTFAEVAQDYIELHVRRERKTEKDRREVAARIRRELVGRWGDRPISEIKNRDVVRMCDQLIKAGGDPKPGSRRRFGGPNAARHALSTARALFNWAVERDAYGLAGNPVVIRAKTAHGSAPRRTRVLGEWEVRAVWLASFDTKPHPYGPIVRMLLLTGQRLNEIARTRWSEVDVDVAVLTLPADRMKGGEGHTVPLTPLAIKLLRDLPRYEGDAHVFSTTRGDRPFSGFSKAKAYLDRIANEVAGRDLAPWTLHDIRRTVRSELSRVGVRNEVAELVIAHRRQGVEAVYDLHRFDDEKRDALLRWEARLRAIVGAPESASEALPLSDVAE